MSESEQVKRVLAVGCAALNTMILTGGVTPVEGALRMLPASDLFRLGQAFDTLSSACLAMSGPSGSDGVPPPVLQMAHDLFVKSRKDSHNPAEGIDRRTVDFDFGDGF
jgi:hypothetical protein